MRKPPLIAFFGALAVTLSGCGGGAESERSDAPDQPVGSSVNAADGINASADASGTTGSSTGDAGSPLNIAADAARDAEEANGSASSGY